MDIASAVARVSGLGEPLTYVAPTFSNRPVEKVESIQANDYRPKYPDSQTKQKADSIQSTLDNSANYRPGDLVNLYA
ncbi:hypothetical protein LPTSP4_28550 [Leptospira ryugenii]|uniref:Uncharacterized protein n=1 Tax=Leptospira ryugenii TaxID=1917863 RepID=A0A2P2E345_9LEPT|nr:hypothetical protein [Leptospira ryugenii]GBF51323.1 hypothetical protein LPTSP4_28550 [Leptospira ryugenii]